jgi:small subunit ribosomal protein S6
VVVLKPDQEEEVLNGTVERLSAVVTGQGGTLSEVNRWGKRRLAYEIGGFREGYYLLLKFQGEAGVPAELERVLKLSEDVLRHLVVREGE